MSSTPIARYRKRAFMAASSIGLLIGASIGSAYVGSALVHDNSTRASAARLLQLASVSEDGSINESELNRLEAATDAAPISRTAMNIALRFSNYAGTGSSPNVLLAQNLTTMRVSDDQRYQGAQVVRVSTGTAGALEAAAPATATVAPRAAAAFAFKGHTQNDLDCLTQGVYYEARGEGVDGMRAVAQVILNRVRHPAYPKTICNVVYQGSHLRTSCQFSFTCNGALGKPIEKWAWRRARDIASDALNGHVMTAVGTATNFHTTGVNPRWSARLERVTQVGTHIFYQFRGRGSRMNGDGVVMPSGPVPYLVQASDTTTPTDGQTVPTPDATGTLPEGILPEMAPTTVSPTGDARTQLIAAVALKAGETPAADAPRATAVKSTLSGKSAQDITAEVAMKPTGVAQ